MPIHSIKVPAKVLALCYVKSEFAQDLNIDELRELVSWCNHQTESLWEDMTLQEILNVYRASGEYISWEGWCQEEPRAARDAWNRAIINPDNKMLQFS